MKEGVVGQKRHNSKQILPLKLMLFQLIPFGPVKQNKLKMMHNKISTLN